MSVNLRAEPSSRIDRVPLYQQVAGLLLERIVDGDPPAGELLPPEPRLTEHYGVSRTVMREALMFLSTKGLISVEHGRGARVLPREDWNIFDSAIIEALTRTSIVVPIIEDLLETRWLIEVEGAALAARRGGPEAADELDACVDEMERALGNPVDYFRWDLEFHARMLAAAHNAVLVRLMEPVKDLLRVARMHVVSVTSERGLRESLDGHRRIVEAVRTGDPDAARAAMTDHLRLSEAERQMADARLAQGDATPTTTPDR